MKYAIYLPTYEPFGHPRVIADLAKDAEEAGWDGMFIWDDVAGHTKDMADPWISLAAAAVQTRRIRLGALVTPLARRRPWKFARETASLDQLSGGRLVVGVGVGGGQDQYGDLGDEPDQRKRGEMLDEALQIVTGLWSGQPYQFEGRYYHLKTTTFRPCPVQQPRIPIWAAGRWPHQRPLARMARWDGMFPLLGDDAGPEEQLARLKKTVTAVMELRKEQLPEIAAAPFDVLWVWGTSPDRPDQNQELLAGFAAAGVTWYLESLEPSRGGGPAWPLERLRERVLAGPPRA
jgi:alkanesulfonate monooxygenase SsuD/methylene tetrahydromethanopterin reductase-like flavin-dependent oxidoreductase (luciferase family)